MLSQDWLETLNIKTACQFLTNCANDFRISILPTEKTHSVRKNSFDNFREKNQKGIFTIKK